MNFYVNVSCALVCYLVDKSGIGNFYQLVGSEKSQDFMKKTSPLRTSAEKKDRTVSVSKLNEERHILKKLVPHNLASEFTPLHILKKGENGIVFSAQSKKMKNVAIKRIVAKNDEECREEKILRFLDNNYCVQLTACFYEPGPTVQTTYISFVTELYPMDLQQLCAKGEVPSILRKLFVFELFSGLSYLHKYGIVHRDLNLSNLIVDPEKGSLRITDFGCAKVISNPAEENTPYMISRPFRAPELIYGCKNYNFHIDIWSAGCIYAYLLKGGPLFQGSSQIAILHDMVRILGVPPQSVIDSYNPSEKIIIPKVSTSSLQAELPAATPDEITFLTEILNFNPKKRPIAQKALEARCFDELFNGLAVLPNKMPLPILDRGNYNHLAKLDFG